MDEQYTATAAAKHSCTERKCVKQMEQINFYTKRKLEQNNNFIDQSSHLIDFSLRN